MINNPFTSQIYELTWLKYFSKYKKGTAFNFIDGLKFYKHKFLPYYINVGRNFTNGITYSIDQEARDYKKKTLLIYDVPDYYNIEEPNNESSIKLYSINQYKGYLAKLDEFSDLDEFLAKQFKNKPRNKFRSTLRKFETCFNVDYIIYHDFISKEEYAQTMSDFKNIIINRFKTLKLDTNLIGEWPFYTELVYKMILERKAILIAIKANNKPVSMSLAFLGNTSLVGAIKAFDTSFYKFNVGHIEISKLIEFCFKHNLKYLDFSKGAYEYKTKWTNMEYQYNCHILYDSSHFVSRKTAKWLARFFKFKQYLRDKNFNFFLVKLKFRLKNLLSNEKNKKPFTVKEIENLDLINNMNVLNLEIGTQKYPFLNRVIFDNLYKFPEPLDNLKIYKSDAKKPVLYVIGNKSQYAIKIN